MKNAREWLGRDLTPEAARTLFSSPVKVDEEGRYGAHLKTKIALGAADGFERFLTNVTAVMERGAHPCVLLSPLLPPLSSPLPPPYTLTQSHPAPLA